MNGTRQIVEGSFVDGSGTSMRRNVLLTVKDSLITAIESTADRPCKESAAVDDLSGCTIVPVLIDCSVSLSQFPLSVHRGMEQVFLIWRTWER